MSNVKRVASAFVLLVGIRYASTIFCFPFYKDVFLYTRLFSLEMLSPFLTLQFSHLCHGFKRFKGHTER
uniref:Putative secreted protein n=1 Tax=Anopheles darlingi TaxID=43151 RepID=A0A2M4D1I0_ANODA